MAERLAGPPVANYAERTSHVCLDVLLALRPTNPGRLASRTRTCLRLPKPEPVGLQKWREDHTALSEPVRWARFHATMLANDREERHIFTVGSGTCALGPRMRLDDGHVRRRGRPKFDAVLILSIEPVLAHRAQPPSDGSNAVPARWHGQPHGLGVVVGTAHHHDSSRLALQVALHHGVGIERQGGRLGPHRYDDRNVNVPRGADPDDAVGDRKPTSRRILPDDGMAMGYALARLAAVAVEELAQLTGRTPDEVLSAPAEPSVGE